MYNIHIINKDGNHLKYQFFYKKISQQNVRQFFYKKISQQNVRQFFYKKISQQNVRQFFYSIYKYK